MSPNVRDQVADSVTGAGCYFRAITNLQNNFQWLQKFKGRNETEAQVQRKPSRQIMYNHSGLLRCRHETLTHYLESIPWVPEDKISNESLSGSSE